ncbi:MAG: SDR family NAD(P)-dependent oxidoreductase [Tetrasphaera sp.]
MRCDVTNADEVAAMAARAGRGVRRAHRHPREQRGDPAGRPRSWTSSPAEWHLVVDANLDLHVPVLQAVQPYMVTAGRGAICNLASMAGRATSTLGGAHYTTAKAGVLGLTRALAREWAGFGITVNAHLAGHRGHADGPRLAR